MIVLAKAITSVKNSERTVNDHQTIASKGRIMQIDRMGVIRLFMRSVTGSAWPRPPQMPQATPKWPLPLNLLRFTQRLQDWLFSPELHVPLLLQ